MTIDTNKAQEFEQDFDYNNAGIEYEKIAKSIKKDEQNYSYYLNLSAINYQKAGSYIKAKENFALALQIYKKLQKNLEICIILNNLASVYDALGDEIRAINLYNKALDSSDDYYKSLIFNNLATIYDKQYNLSQAQEYYEKSLDIIQNQLKLDNNETLTTLSNLGVVYLKQNNAKAKEILEDVLNKRARILPTYHPDIATSINNLAFYYYQNNDYSKSIDLLEKALEISIDTVGLEHIDTYTSICNLAKVYANTDKAKSNEMYNKALEIAMSVFGESSEEVQQIKSIITHA